jgi:homeobox-leucine zipper protein
MASNGMASAPSPFFPPNFLLQMQQTPSDHEHQEQHHHHHHHKHHLAAPPLHPHHNPFLPSSQCPSLQDFRGHAQIDGIITRLVDAYYPLVLTCASGRWLMQVWRQ